MGGPYDGARFPTTHWSLVARAGVSQAEAQRQDTVAALLVGLAAGWWVAHAFTASYWDRLTSRFGLRSGTREISRLLNHFVHFRLDRLQFLFRRRAGFH